MKNRKLEISCIMAAPADYRNPTEMFKCGFEEILRKIMECHSFSNSRPLVITVSQDTGHKK